jgi:branched-chain amino acid transport system substrate-binding protein
VIYAAGPYGQSGATLLQRLAPPAGLSIAVEEQFQPLDSDMTAQIVRVRDANPDALLIWATDPGATLVVKQAAALGFKKPVYNSPAVADPKFIRNVGPAAEGTYVQGSRLLVAAELAANDPQRPGLVWLTDTYRKRFNEEPPQNAGHPYDALLLIEQAVKGINGPVNGTSLAEGLAKAKACGANGCFQMSATDHNGLPPNAMVILKAKDGRWVLDK